MIAQRIVLPVETPSDLMTGRGRATA